MNCIKGKFLKATFLTAVSCFTLLSAAENDIYKMKVGDISVTSILDTTFPMQVSLFKTGDTSIIKSLMPDGALKSPVNVFLVKNSKQTILVDAGISTSVVDKLKKNGVQPEKVDLILITHGHYDHVGGLVNDGKPVFPNAKIMISEKEKALYEDSVIAKLPAEVKPYFLPANQMLKVYAKNIVTFVAGKQVADGITSVDLNGHTAGQTGYMIESKGKKLLLAGDILHVSAVQFAHPQYSLVYDADVDQAAKERTAILEQAVQEKFLFGGAHMTFPGIGEVSKGSEGFIYTVVK